MSIDRRRLLQFSGAGCVLAAMPAIAGAGTSLRAFQVRDAVALPRFDAGDLVVADTSVGRYAGAGLYLYPAWGQPRLYEVLATGDRLEFRNPGTGVLLWTQSTSLDSVFAGRLLDRLDVAGLPSLAVPRLPATA